MLATGAPGNTLRRPVGRPALLLLGIGAFFVVVVFATAAASYFWPDAPWPPTETTVIGNSAKFEPGSVTPVRDDERHIFGWLVHLENGQFIAFDRREPVIGCTLVWGRSSSIGFSDPCHGYEYDITGEPSPDNPVLQPMNRLDLRIDRDGTLRIVTVTREAP